MVGRTSIHPVIPLIKAAGIENMQTRHTATATFLTLLLVVLAPPCISADKPPSFEEIYASNDKMELTDWGGRYVRGFGVAKDPQKAIALFCKSARLGDTSAKLKLGELYAFGRGVKRDEELAAAWLYEAAKDKNPMAEMMLKVFRVEGKPKLKPKASCPLATDTRITRRPPPSSRPSRPHPATGKIASMVRSMAPKYRLNPNLVLAVVETESGFNPNALSPKNAQGLMQLIPATAERFGVENAWDPEQNLKGGMAYLRWLLDYFDGDVELALAGYNAGEKVVKRYGGIPPYAETQAYVERIIRRIGGRG